MNNAKLEIQETGRHSINIRNMTNDNTLFKVDIA